MSDSNGSINSEDEALQVLLDADIDKVMAGLDQIVEAAPSYEKLFSRWENQQWNSESLRLLGDKAQWEQRRLHRRAEGVHAVGDVLVLPRRGAGDHRAAAVRDRRARPHEARAFLATQISDEAKHMVFFDRFYREVFGVTPRRWRRT